MIYDGTIKQLDTRICGDGDEVLELSLYGDIYCCYIHFKLDNNYKLLLEQHSTLAITQDINLDEIKYKIIVTGDGGYSIFTSLLQDRKYNNTLDIVGLSVANWLDIFNALKLLKPGNSELRNKYLMKIESKIDELERLAKANGITKDNYSFKIKHGR